MAANPAVPALRPAGRPPGSASPPRGRRAYRIVATHGSGRSSSRPISLPPRPTTVPALAGVPSYTECVNKGPFLRTRRTARRGGLLPENALTHAIAPPASALALFALTALYLRQRDRAGTLGLVGFAVNLVGLAGLFAVEFTTHAVFPYLDETTRTDLLAGPTRLLPNAIPASLHGRGSWWSR